MRLLLTAVVLTLFACEVPDPDPMDEPMGGGTAGSGGGAALPFAPAFSWFSVTGATVPMLTVKCTTRGVNGVTGEMMSTLPATLPANATALTATTVPGQVTFGGGTINSTVTVTPMGNTVTVRFQANGTASSGPRPTDDTNCSAAADIQFIACSTSPGTYPVTFKLRGSGTEGRQDTSSSLLNSTLAGGNLNLSVASVGAVPMLPKEATGSLSLTKTASGNGNNCPIVNIHAQLTISPTGTGTTATVNTLSTDLTTTLEMTSP